jgi:hypothetical protein
MTTIEKAKARLESLGIEARIESFDNSVYISLDCNEFELSEAEIKYQAEMYDKEKELDQTELVAYLMSLTGQGYDRTSIEYAIGKKLNREVEFCPSSILSGSEYLHYLLFIYDNEGYVEWEIVFEVLIGSDEFLYLKGVEREQRFI